MNADPEVMQFFRGTLDRTQSDAFLDRIEQSFGERGFGLWAVERRSDGAFLGFTGLAWQTYDAPFTPAAEVGWRYARSAWGNGYATEAASAALTFGFEQAGLDEIVSVTSRLNTRSQRVMDRLGMTRNPDEDFDYPLLPEGHPLRPSVLYRITKHQWSQPREW